MAEPQEELKRVANALEELGFNRGSKGLVPGTTEKIAVELEALEKIEIHLGNISDNSDALDSINSNLEKIADALTKIAEVLDK